MSEDELVHLNVFGLLVVDADNQVYPNLRDPRNAVTTYVRCAALMAKSALAAGHDVTIVTNDPAFVSAAFAELDVPPQVKVRERQFTSQLPVGTEHRAAHHKLDLVRDLAREAGRVSAIVDLDAIFVNPITLQQSQLGAALGVYEITDDMEGESGGRAAGDVRRLAGTPIDRPRWFGGEMIVGEASAFAALSRALERVEQPYFDTHSDLYHSGDETLVSTALNLMLTDGAQLVDIGASNTVQRWWSSRRPHRQRTLSGAMHSSVIHLPADKEFLAREASLPFDVHGFRRRLRSYARTKVLSRRLSNVAHRMKPGSPRLSSPRL